MSVKFFPRSFFDSQNAERPFGFALIRLACGQPPSPARGKAFGAVAEGNELTVWVSESDLPGNKS